jgi:hypothetical protein
MFFFSASDQATMARKMMVPMTKMMTWVKFDESASAVIYVYKYGLLVLSNPKFFIHNC